MEALTQALVPMPVLVLVLVLVLAPVPEVVLPLAPGLVHVMPTQAMRVRTLRA